MSHIAIITGGTSSERPISLRSVESVRMTLEDGGYKTVTYDFRKDVEKFLSDPRPDFAFVMMHGKGGEDGQTPAFLEVMGIPHQGTTFETHAVCIDKIHTKHIWRKAWLPVAPDCILSADNISREEFLHQIRNSVGFPCVIKNPTEGSTIGCYILPDENTFNRCWTEISHITTPLLVERFVTGREVTISILDMPDGTTQIFPIVEIIPPEWATFDYENKYNGKTAEICPAPFSDTVSKRIQNIALQAYRSLWVRGYGRVDAIVDESNTPCLLEINTIPGFTNASLFPLAAKTTWISFLNLLEILMETGKQYNQTVR